MSAALLLSFSAQAQLRVSPLAPAAVPAALQLSGRVVQALRYTDRTGAYTVLATEIAPWPDPAAQSSNGQRADLCAYHYPATGLAGTRFCGRLPARPGSPVSAESAHRHRPRPGWHGRSLAGVPHHLPGRREPEHPENHPV